MKWFVGMPQQNAKEFSKRILQEDFARKFCKKILQEDFSKRFCKKIFPNPKKNYEDNSRVKYIKQTKRDSLRYRLEQQAYFPQENEGLVDIFKKTFLHYFLPFPPPPPLEDPRNIFPENKNGSEKE